MGRKKEKKVDKSKKTKERGDIKNLIKNYFDKHSNEVKSHKQICDELAIKDNELRKSAYRAMEAMMRAGFIKQVGHGIYKKSAHIQSFEGELQLTSRGAGYLIVDGLEKDIYIHPKNTGHAMNGDFVLVYLNGRSKPNKPEGEVIKVIHRERSLFVGNLYKQRDQFVFVSDDLKNPISILIPPEKLNGAEKNDKVIAKITVWPKGSAKPFGEIVELLQSHTANDQEMIGVLVSHGINYKFPPEVMQEAEKIGIELDPEEVAKRKDCRDLMTLTIDPKDAKDFDDALSYTELENGNYQVGVHIADVSHYVRPEMAMSKEALSRSNSVYLVDRVVPMLPEQLSNIACSLRPNEDKFAFSILFEMDGNGQLISHWMGKTVIRSNRRMTYEEAQEIIEGKQGDENEKEVLFLDKIAKTYRKERLKHGGIDFVSEEIRFELNEQGNPVGTISKVSKDANKLIEEFMLLANKTVAKFIGDVPKGHDIVPFIYRIHEPPSADKISFFQMFIDKFGYELSDASPENLSASINELLSNIQYENEAGIIQQMAIRTMSKAAYDVKNLGHYGLGFSYYTHFTSPIRRYADLMVHRILFQELEHHSHRYDSELSDIAKLISRNERKAIEAERESGKYFQALFMKERVGEVFDARITGLTDFGIFAEITETHCEGMISIKDLTDDRYYYDNESFCVIGYHSEKTYNFGDTIQVKVKSVDTRKKEINLMIP